MEPNLLVRAPVAGQVVPLSDVPDPVFAEQLLGAGLGVAPAITAPERQPMAPEFQPVFAPISGTLAKMMPHAFIIQSEEAPEKAVMVHLGLDTVKLQGDGFRWEVTEGAQINCGTELGAWNPRWIMDQGFDPVCLVVALQAPTANVADLLLAGAEVSTLDPLFTW